MPNPLKSLRLERLSYDSTVNNIGNAMNILRKNIEALQNYFDSNGQLDGFVHLDFTVPSGSTEVKIKHGLGYVPKDILITRIIAPSGVKLTLHHDKFDTDNLVVSATGTGDVKVRMLAGTYKNSSAAAETLDAGSNQEVKAIL